MKPVVSAAPVLIRYATIASICLILGVVALTGQAQQARTIASGVYSAAQSGRGQAYYQMNCAVCHGPELKGAVGPMLTGDGFLSNWAGRLLADLVDKIEKTMPPQTPASTSRADARDVAAFVLQYGKFPAGQAELTDASLAGVSFPGTPKPAGRAAGGVALTPTANLAQLMRGVTFYNANVLLNVQVKNPADPKGGPPVPFDYVQWGMWNYYGWQSIDNAALALQETTPLFLEPGRRCENGQPVPVDKADFRQYANDLIALAKEYYKVSQTRDAQAVADLSEKLDAACAACHRVYRDAAREGAVRTDKCIAIMPPPAK
jgi:quinoprotein glucose dehydrogenase